MLIRVALRLGPVVFVAALSRWSGPPPIGPIAPAFTATGPAAQRPSSTGMLRSATPASPSSAAGGAVSGPAPRTARSAR